MGLRGSGRFRAVRHAWSRGFPIQFVKFCIVGGSGYVINLVVYTLLLRRFELSYQVAAVGAFTLAATNNYIWNRLWTFSGAGGRTALQGTQFLVVSGTALAANLLLLRILVEFGVDPLVAQATAIVLVTPLNFLGNKYWTFRQGSPVPDFRRRIQPAAPTIPRVDYAGVPAHPQQWHEGDLAAPSTEAARAAATPLRSTTVPEAS